MFKRKKQKRKNKYRAGVGKKVSNKRISYGKKRVREKTVRRKVKKTASFNWAKLGVVFLIICFLIFVGWVLLMSSVMKITEVEVEGYNNQSEILNKTNKLKQEKIFNKLSRDNLILFSKNKLQQQIQQDNLVIKNVTIKKQFPNKLIINIVPRKKIVLWHFQDKCQLRDLEGVLIKNIDCRIENTEDLNRQCQDKKVTAGLPCLPISINGNLQENNLKDIQKSSQIGWQILDFLKQTTYFNENISFRVPDVGWAEIYVDNPQYGKLLFSTTDNLEQQLQSLKLLLEKKLSLSQLQQMDYIDLRLENKIIYKLKEDSSTSTEENFSEIKKIKNNTISN